MVLKSTIKSFRLISLTVSATPWLACLFISLMLETEVNYFSSFTSLVGILLLQLGVNMYNDVSDFKKKVDIVIQNAPFGTKDKNADRVFLDTAFMCSNIVYHFHKTVTKKFMERYSQDNNFKITQVYDYQFFLKKQYSFHKSNKKRIEVSISRMERINS
jgi:predicted RNA methylase